MSIKFEYSENSLIIEDEMSKKPNFLIIAIDTLRADHLGCYGYDQPTSPFIDNMAEKSVLYENCYSHAPWTIPSFTSLFSGLDPICSRIVGSPWNVPNYKNIHFNDLALTLPEIMREAGYLTFAIDNLVEMASHPSWFVRGFRTYINLTDKLFLRHHHLLAEQVTDEMIAWHDLKAEKPWFAFLHYWDPHLPYNYPKRYDELLKSYRPKPVKTSCGRDYLLHRGLANDISNKYTELIAQYDRSILYLDNELQRLFDVLETFGVLEDTVVIILGDHGEAMVEHGVLFDHSLLYDPTIHVPLIIYDPRTKQSSRVKDFAQHHDILPTICTLAEIEPKSPVTGQPLQPFGTSPPRDFIVSTQDGGEAMRAILTHDWKMICHYDLEQTACRRPAKIKKTELYDLKNDPFELTDLSEILPDIALTLSTKLESWRINLMRQTDINDPLLDKHLRINFKDYPGDPVLVEFYRSLTT